MKCNHCGEELGNGDIYDLMKAHIGSCPSKVARDYQNALDEETEGEY